MARLSYTEGLLADVADASPDETIDKIKAAVIDSLEKMDASATIRKTEFFNHTFAPDLLLRWPHRNGMERPVFIKLSENAQLLSEAVKAIGELEPLMVTIGTPTNEKGKPVKDGSVLDETATTYSTLVSDLAGVRAVSAQRKTLPLAALVGNALAQGGRGLMNQSRARAAVRSVDSGFAGAKRHDSKAILAAKRTALNLLTDEHAQRLDRFLQAVWIGSGGRASEFPGSSPVGGQLDDDAWTFLLMMDEIEDPEFWSRIGKDLTLNQASRFRYTDSSVNFQHLIDASQRSLRGRTCRVVDEPKHLLDEDVEGGWLWVVRNGTLALRGPEFTAYVAEKSDDLVDLSSEDDPPIPVEDLRERRGRARISELMMSDGNEQIEVSTKDGKDAIDSKRRRAVSKAWNGRERVRRAKARLPSGSDLGLDFTKSTASAITKSVLPLSDLVGYGVRLLRDIPGDDAAALSSKIPIVDSEDQSMLDLIETGTDEVDGIKTE